MQDETKMLDFLLSSLVAFGSFGFFLFVLSYGWLTAFKVIAQ
ncbi:hypothetical protein [Kiloniella sp.]